MTLKQAYFVLKDGLIVLQYEKEMSYTPPSWLLTPTSPSSLPFPLFFKKHSLYYWMFNILNSCLN